MTKLPCPLRTNSPPVGIPTAYYFGQVQLHDVLILDRLGPSLESVFDTCGRRFSSKTVWMLAKQMVRWL